MYPRTHTYYNHLSSAPPSFFDSQPLPQPLEMQLYPFPYPSHLHHNHHASPSSSTTTPGGNRPPMPHATHSFHSHPMSPMIAFPPTPEYTDPCLPRTAILRGLSAHLNVQLLLDAIHFGPIEYVFLKKPQPHVVQTDRSLELSADHHHSDTPAFAANGTTTTASDPLPPQSTLEDNEPPLVAATTGTGTGAGVTGSGNDLVEGHREPPPTTGTAAGPAAGSAGHAGVDPILEPNGPESNQPKPSPPSKTDTSDAISADSTGYLLFVDPQICSAFYHTFRNRSNLARLRTDLNSPLLKVYVNESDRPDFIKMKTLNYIMEFGATRCLEITLPSDTELEEVKEKCAKFGDVELFETVDPPNGQDSDREEFEQQQQQHSPEESGADRTDDNTPQKFSSFRAHFTSIDLAIRCYEHLPKSCKHQDRTSVLFGTDRCTNDGTLKSPSPKATPGKRHLYYTTEPSRLSHTNGERSQRPMINGAGAPNSSVSSSSLNLHGHAFLPDESIISIPEDDSYGLDNSEMLSDYILENDQFHHQHQHQHHSNPQSTASVHSSSRHTHSGISHPHNQFYPPPHFYHHHHHQLLARSLANMGAAPPPPHPDMMVAAPPFSPQVREVDYIPSLAASLYYMTPYQSLAQSLNLQNYQGCHNMMYPPGDSNVGNRTIYLGNIHPKTTIEEIANNVRAGGLVQQIKYHKEKRVCFITFIDAAVALKFYLNHQVLHQLVIHGYDITVGWAKQHSGPLNRDIMLAVSAGASRNVYIGIKPKKDDQEPDVPRVELPLEEELRTYFSKFGELEQINFYHNRDCGFLNFINISDAIKLVEAFAIQNIDRINKIVGDEGEFYKKYLTFKINFAKDRCGNPPKFSIKKKPPKNKIPRDEDLYEVDIVNELRENSRIEEEMRLSLALLKESPPLNEEAAMVFGIISGNDDEKKKSSSGTAVAIDSQSKAKGLGLLSIDEQNLDEEEEFLSDLAAESNDNSDELSLQPLEITAHSLKSDKKDFNQLNQQLEKMSSNVNGNANGSENANVNNGHADADDNDAGDKSSIEDDNEDDDDEDEVSIIIFSENDEQKPKGESSGKKKFYKSRSEPHRKGFSHNGSSISLNSGHSGYFNPAQPNYQGKSSSSPYISQLHQMYYMPQHRAQPGPVRVNSFGYAGPPSSGMPSPLPGVAPGGMPIMYAAGNSYMSYPPPPPPMVSQGSFKGQYVTSGSQVMAQYLAQSQHEGYVFANTMYNNQAMMEEEDHYYRRRRRS